MITSTATSPTNAATIPISIDFGEDVTRLLDAEVVVVGATKSVGLAGGPQVYTLTLAPTGDGTVTVNIAAAAAQDLSSNDCNAATEFSIVSDQTAPAPSISFFGRGSDRDESDSDFGGLWRDGHGICRRRSDGRQRRRRGRSVDVGSGRLYGPGDADGGRGGDGGHCGDGSR